MKYSIIPCRYDCDELRLLLQIVPLMGGAFGSKSKFAWIKDYYGDGKHDPRNLKVVTNKLIPFDEYSPAVQGKTYSQVLTEPLPLNHELCMDNKTKEFWIIGTVEEN